MPNLTDKAWSPYVAGAIIGLLQIPTFLLMDTALSEVLIQPAMGESSQLDTLMLQSRDFCLYVMKERAS